MYWLVSLVQTKTCMEKTITPNNTHIKSTIEINDAINAHKGEACRVKLCVKYEIEKDWIDHYLWMVPGWRPLEIWRDAYSWLNQQDKFYFQLVRQHAKVEEVHVEEFKLV